MRRIYSDYAYGTGPREGCWWDDTIAAPDWPVLAGDLSVDVGIVGGGFTGMSAALTLAEAGMRVAVLEAATPVWGASGRNGGFCCLGGAKLEHATLVKRYGADGARQFHAAERAAVDLVAQRLDAYGIDADRHSDGETLLAHSPRAMDHMRRDAVEIAAIYGIAPRVIEPGDLRAEGLGGAFHGAVTIPIGFGLNPRKYLFGIARAAADAGATLYQQSPVTRITAGADGVVLQTGAGRVRCAQALIATNGYSSEDVPDWMAGRYMPTQSNVLVTRPLSEAELAAQGWWSDQMSYDSRNLLHYFRLMPDRRFLFGSRGGLRSSPGAEAAARARNRRDFESMFPAWAEVPSAHQWSGMVCLSHHLAPYIGPVPDLPGVIAALAYHGNGVAMGSWSGTRAARLMLDPATEVPPPMQGPLRRFPLGRARRAVMPPAYAAMWWQDRT